MTPAEFWVLVDKRGPAECWPWLGTTNSQTRPYGIATVNGKRQMAHRIAWELHHGEAIPEGLWGCHHCDNTICANPLHIFIGTHVDNRRDAQAKGRDRPTHCKRGHEFTEENTYWKQGKWRECLTCKKANDAARPKKDRSAYMIPYLREYRKRKKAEALLATADPEATE